jgi:hypothetical protein
VLVIRSVEQTRGDVGRAMVAPLSALMPLSSHDAHRAPTADRHHPTPCGGAPCVVRIDPILSLECHRTPGVGVLETHDRTRPAPDPPAPASYASRTAGGDRDRTSRR